MPFMDLVFQATMVYGPQLRFDPEAHSVKLAYEPQSHVLFVNSLAANIMRCRRNTRFSAETNSQKFLNLLDTFLHGKRVKVKLPIIKKKEKIQRSRNLCY